MSRDTVADWSTTAADNTDVGGVPLGEGVMYPSDINNSIREMMAQLAEVVPTGLTIPPTNDHVLQVPGSFAVTAQTAATAAFDAGIVDYDASTKNLRFIAGSDDATESLITWLTGTSSALTEKMRLDGDGVLMIGTTTANPYTGNVAGIALDGADDVAYLSRAGVSLYLNRLSSDGTVAIFGRQAVTVGSISVSGTATAYNTSSDERLKENFIDFDAGAILDAIHVYQYEWKADGSAGYGPKAQELAEVFPTAVSEGSTGDQPGDPTFQPWGYDASKLVPLLVREVQSLRQRVAALEP